MIARIPLLTGLLVAQLVILAVLWLAGDEEGSTAELLGFDPAEVTELGIADADGTALDLAVLDGQWSIDGLPADGSRISEVIESLAGGSASWPVATSASSQERFEVAEDVFQRRVRFGGESGELATLYLGSSPGFRRIHAREAGADAIFSIDFGLHQLPVDASDWLDKQLLQVETVSSLTFPDGTVLGGDDAAGWTLDGQPADLESVQRFLDRIEGLTVLGLHAADSDTVLGESVSVSLEDNEGAHTLSFRFNEAADEYVLESDRMPGAFTVASYIVEQILIAPSELLAEEAATQETAEDEVGESEPEAEG